MFSPEFLNEDNTKVLAHIGLYSEDLNFYLNICLDIFEMNYFLS